MGRSYQKEKGETNVSGNTIKKLEKDIQSKSIGRSLEEQRADIVIAET